MNDNQGHGWVVPRADGAKTRCGGPRICAACQAELAAAKKEVKDVVGRYFNLVPCPSDIGQADLDLDGEFVAGLDRQNAARLAILLNEFAEGGLRP